MLENVCYDKIASGIYSCKFDGKLRGHVIYTRSGWCFIPAFGQYVYWGSTRDKAVLPHFDYRAFGEYRKNHPEVIIRRRYPRVNSDDNK